MKTALLIVGLMCLAACASSGQDWRLALKHDRDGTVVHGNESLLVDAVRRGCPLRVAWGTRRRADPTRTIEHVATPSWVSLRDGQHVEVQLDEFMINLSVLGEPPEDHANRAPFGGTERAVYWRASLKTDGSFDAIWFDRQTGELIRRVPQRHAMSWFVQCAPQRAEPLYID
ncbi:MAG: hypothetical protein AB8G17_19030 [Gammaproteobacteria bacterium]